MRRPWLFGTHVEISADEWRTYAGRRRVENICSRLRRRGQFRELGLLFMRGNLDYGVHPDDPPVHYGGLPEPLLQLLLPHLLVQQ